MAKLNTAWGIEIGQYAVKAIQLERVGDEVRVRDFAVIPHVQVLTDPEISADGDQGAAAKLAAILEMSLAALATQKQLTGQKVVVNYNWMQSRGFARFAKLPAVSPREIPNLVRYEVDQQIPFPIDDIEWGFHAFQSPESPEVEVGLFAVQKEPLAEFLALVGEKLGVEPTAVTLAPIALYNAFAFDRGIPEKNEPFVLLDIGTSSTDLIVAYGSRCWMRTFPLGGHNFTEAIAAEFKFPYRQSDALKQESATSKYAKQIMTAMRPVFGDLIGDVQKSLQFYESQNRGVKLRNVIGMGSTLKIPGLRKFIGMQLNLEVERLDHFERIAVEGPASADFAQHIVGFGVAYGLALQGLDMAAVNVNLLPLANVRQQLWSRKTRWFAAAAAVACAAGALMFTRSVLDNGALGDVVAVNAAQAEVSSAKNFQTQLTSKAADIGSLSKNMVQLVEDREVWPFLVHDAVGAVAAGNSADALGDDFSALIKAAPAGSTRMQTRLRDLSGVYKLNSKGERVIEVSMDLEFSGPDRENQLGNTVCKWLEDNARRDAAPYEIVNVQSNNSMIANLKVGADGVLIAEASGDSSSGGAGGTTTAAADEAQGFNRPGGSFSAGGGAGGSNFGGVAGRRAPTGNTAVQRPGGRLGGAGAGGGFNADDPTLNEGTTGAGGSNFQRPSGEQQSQSTVDLDKIAPIPARPGVYPPGSTVYVGKVTFEVKLKGVVPAAAAAAEGQ
ncbi:MAG: pilus assembly protein PilM [Planctomycetota bacterium]|jgi:type IV pilus assembly protein PilM|nr:pilus assembly protein PilM [Planctomycetota bacterium]